jgi:flavin reductase (DIM6/NTAB) family NADH-FMN oxidoreductase RutF
MIKQSGEFVLNLTTEELATATDQCGVVSASKCPDKWELTGLTKGKALHLDHAPIIMESPLNIECTVRDIISLGSHDMFIGEVVGIDASEEWVAKDGTLHLDDANLIAFSSRDNKTNAPVGSYVKLGETIGRYGFTAKADIRTH